MPHLIQIEFLLLNQVNKRDAIPAFREHIIQTRGWEGRSWDHSSSGHGGITWNLASNAISPALPWPTPSETVGRCPASCILMSPPLMCSEV